MLTVVATEKRVAEGQPTISGDQGNQKDAAGPHPLTLKNARACFQMIDDSSKQQAREKYANAVWKRDFERRGQVQRGVARS